MWVLIKVTYLHQKKISLTKTYIQWSASQASHSLKKVSKVTRSMKRARIEDPKEEEGRPKRKGLTQTTVHSFFGGNPGPSAINPGLQYGIRVYTDKEINEVEGLEGEFRKFWNEKAAELCNNAAVRHKLRNKTAIQGAIHTSWNLHKTSLLEIQVDELRAKATDAYIEESTVSNKLASIERNAQRMRDTKDRISILSQQLERGEGDPETPTQLHVEMSELKKAQDALKKALQRRKAEIDIIIQEQQKKSLESASCVPQLTDEELEDVVQSVTEDYVDGHTDMQ